MLNFKEFLIQKEQKQVGVRYAPKPPKQSKKPPIERSNVSKVSEILGQIKAAFTNHRRAFQRNPNKKHNNRIIGMYAGDTNKEEATLTESYDSFNIAKPAGYGTFLTAADLGIKIKAGFAHHPSVEEEIASKTECDCDECKHERKKIKHKKRVVNHD